MRSRTLRSRTLRSRALRIRTLRRRRRTLLLILRVRRRRCGRWIACRIGRSLLTGWREVLLGTLLDTLLVLRLELAPSASLCGRRRGLIRRRGRRGLIRVLSQARQSADK